MFKFTMVCRIYRKELENDGIPDVQKALEKQFSSWFKKHVSFFSLFSLNYGHMNLFSPCGICTDCNAAVCEGRRHL